MRASELQKELIQSGIGEEDILKEAYRKLAAKEEDDEKFLDALSQKHRWKDIHQNLSPLLSPTRDKDAYRYAPKEAAKRDMIGAVGNALLTILEAREAGQNKKILLTRKQQRALERQKELDSLKSLAHQAGSKKEEKERKKEDLAERQQRAKEEHYEHRRAMEEEDRRWREQDRTAHQEDRDLRRQEHNLRMKELTSKLAEKEGKQTRQEQIAMVEAFKRNMNPDEYAKMLAKAQRGEFNPEELEQKGSTGGIWGMIKGKSKPMYHVKEEARSRQIPMKKPDGTIVWVEDD